MNCQLKFARYWKVAVGMTKLILCTIITTNHIQDTLLICCNMNDIRKLILKITHKRITLKEETVAGINCREINLATFATVSSSKDRFWPFGDS